VKSTLDLDSLVLAFPLGLFTVLELQNSLLSKALNLEVSIGLSTVLGIGSSTLDDGFCPDLWSGSNTESNKVSADLGLISILAVSAFETFKSSFPFTGSCLGLG
jgi:hypothetical protein